MSINRFDALDATSTHIVAVIRLVGGLFGASEPNKNCGIFDSEPVGVIPVSAVELAAISVSTRISGIAAMPRSQRTSNQACAIHTPNAPMIGTPTYEI